MTKGNAIIRKITWSIMGAFLCFGALAAFAPQFARAEEAADGCSIDYIYVESPHLELGETQRIAVGFSSAPDSTPQALVVADGGGSVYEIPVTMNAGLDCLFSRSSLPEEQYEVTGLIFESGKIISFGEDAAAFGIGRYECASTAAASDDDFDTKCICDQGLSNSVSAYSLSGASSARSGQFVIALDAGHGGWSSGAVGNGLLEKDLTLKIAKYCKLELEKYDGVKVVMVRDSDTALTSGDFTGEELQRRCALANENHADFYMSIHINAGGGTGAEVWIPNTSTWYQSFHQEGADVGNRVLDRILALGLANRGLKEANYEVDGNRLYYPDGSNADAFAVIRYCREYGIPAVLVEHGFIDNPRDAAKLSDDSFLEQIGIADAQAIVDRFGLSKVKKPLPFVADEDNHSVALQWDEIPGATQYAIALCNSDGTFETYTYDCADTNYTVNGLTNGQSYTFLVQAKVNGKWTPFSERDYMECTLIPRPRASAEAAGDGEARLTWGAVDGADAYAVAERLGDGSYRTYTYSATGTSYTVTGLQCGVEHRFLVQARVAGRWSSFGEGNLVSCVPSGPTRPSVSATASDGSVGLSWAEVPGAERYAVAWRRSGDSSWRTSTYDCRGGSYTVTGLSNGTAYEFVVQARFPGRWSDFGPGDVVSATTKGTPIMGSAMTTVDRMVSVYESSGATYPSSVYVSKGAASIRSFCMIVYNEATAEGVRPEVLFAQAMHETGWLMFGGDVSPDQCNFGGLGAVGNGASGLTFSDVTTGLRAQVQHLKAYASTDPLRLECVDPRFRYVMRGCAPCVEDLTGRWAAGHNYAASIVSIINCLI